MKLAKFLVESKLARTGMEAQRLIKSGAVRVGGCSEDCSFFSTGKCNCGGWEQITNPGQEVQPGLAVKVGGGFWRLVNRLDGQSGFDQLNGIARVNAQKLAQS
jgi:predicted rRNA methylase YqxC with S4 and FtsJ domains